MPRPLDITLTPDVLDVGWSSVVSALPPEVLMVQRALETVAGSTMSNFDVIDGQQRLSAVLSFATGSGKTNTIASLLGSVSGFGLGQQPPETDSYFTPRQVVRWVDRASRRTGRESQTLDTGSADGRWFRPWRSRLQPAERRLRRFARPEPLSPAEQLLGSRPSETAIANRAGLNLSAPERGLDRTRQLVAAIWRSLTPTLLIWFSTLLDEVGRLLAARRWGRASTPPARTAVAGSRAAAARGGPRGPGRLGVFTCTFQVGLTLGRASAGG